MANVAVIYAVRKLGSRLALECYALAASFVGVAVLVSLPNVEANLATTAGRGIMSVPGFIFAAVLRTELSVQLMLLVGALAALSLFVDIFRSRLSSRALAA